MGSEMCIRDRFGTFFNPRGFADETGFYDGASRRVAAMLAFRNVATTPHH